VGFSFSGGERVLGVLAPDSGPDSASSLGWESFVGVLKDGQFEEVPKVKLSEMEKEGHLATEEVVAGGT